MSGSQTRRNFVKSSAIMSAGIIIAPGITLHCTPKNAIAQNKPGKVRWGLLIDTNKCTPQCTACVQACNIEHGLGKGDRPKTDAQWIRKVELQHKNSNLIKSLPMLCQHCEDPPCVDVCPTNASFKRDDGIVLVNKHTCIGCRYCMMACPYKARSFVHEKTEPKKSYAPRGKGTVESCTFCVHRIDQNKNPACVNACHSQGMGAMTFGNINDPNSKISKELAKVSTRKIRNDLGLNTSVHYQNI